MHGINATGVHSVVMYHPHREAAQEKTRSESGETQQRKNHHSRRCLIGITKKVASPDCRVE